MPNSINSHITDVIQEKLDISRDQAVFITLALSFVQTSQEFELDYGRFGVKAIAQACEHIATLQLD